MTNRIFLESDHRLLIWVGLCRPLDVHWILSVLFIFRTIVIIGIYVMVLVGCVAHAVVVLKNDLLSASVNILQIIIYVTSILHISYYQLRNKMVHQIVEQVRSSFRASSNTGHFTMDGAITIQNRITASWTSLCAITCVFWCMVAIGRGEFPIPFWAPGNLQESSYYGTITFVQFLGQFLVGTLAGTFGSFYFSVLSLVGKQFEMIKYSLMHLAPLAMLKMQRKLHRTDDAKSTRFTPGSRTMCSIDAGTNAPHQCECCSANVKRQFEAFEKRRFENELTMLECRVYREELYALLKDCIDHHQKIVGLKRIINDFFGLVFVLKFLLSTAMLCFIIYPASKYMTAEEFRTTDAKFLVLLGYYTVAASEMFIFCYVADRFSRLSGMISKTIYEYVPWSDRKMPKDFIATLKIFHLNSRNPIILETPFYSVSLQTFRKMFSSSVSYYMLLRRLQRDL